MRCRMSVPTVSAKNTLTKVRASFLADCIEKKCCNPVTTLKYNTNRGMNV